MRFDFHQTFLKIPNQLNDSDINQVRDYLSNKFNVKNLCELGVLKDYYKGKVGNTSEIDLAQLDNPHLLDGELKDYPFWSKLFILAKTLLEREDCRVLASHAILKKAHSSSSIPPHQDLAYWGISNIEDCVSLLIPLSRCRKENGGLYYYEEDSYGKLYDHRHYHKEGGALEIELDSSPTRTYLNCEAGDIIVHHPYSIHGSENNESEIERIVLVIIFKAD